MTGCWICLGYSFRFAFGIDPFISPKVFNSMSTPHTKCLFNVYTGSIALGVGPIQIWQQGYHNNVCFVILKFWLTLGWSLHYSLELLLLTLNVRCLLWMSLNATLWHIFVERQTRRYIYGNCWKKLVIYLHRYLSISSYDDVIFILFFYFIAVPTGKTFSMSFITHCFNLFLTLSKFSQYFKVLMFTTETVF